MNVTGYRPRTVDRSMWALLAVVTPAMIGTLWLIFFHAPEERVMGAVQRLFYFHVPAAILTYLAVLIWLAGSIAYLWRREARWDRLSRAAIEVGLLFCTIVLITGPIWAKPAWGHWWTWEMRLTTTLILWLLLVAALMVRSYAETPELGARLSSVVGIVAAIDVFVIRKAVEWFRGQHPEVLASGRGALEPRMAQAFAAANLTLLLLFVLLLLVRYRTLELESRVEAAGHRALG